MTTFADIPRAIRAGIVVVDPDTGGPQRVIVMQFNPDSLERSIQPQAADTTSTASGTGTDGDRNEALRLKGPAEEQWKFTAEIDATDQLDVPAPDGIHPQLAALEMLVQPTTAQLRDSIDRTRKGIIEVNPIETPLTLFTWGNKRVMPVRLTEFSVNEQAFDVNLNPIRASLSISLKILTVSDLPVGHPGADLYVAHLAIKEQLAARGSTGTLGALGLTGASIRPGG
jgi:hypothetical protein